MSEDCHDSGGGLAQVKQGSESRVISSATMEVYLDDGKVFEYQVHSENNVAAKAREHCSAIINNGYRHNDGKGEFEHYPTHRITKVKVTGIPVDTKYVNAVTGT